jgi:hypothetical protein
MRKNHGYAKIGQIIKLDESIADFFVSKGLAEWTGQPVKVEEKPVEAVVEKPKKKRRRRKTKK